MLNGTQAYAVRIRFAGAGRTDVSQRFLVNNFADFPHAMWFKKIKISIGRWWRSELATSPFDDTLLRLSIRAFFFLFLIYLSINWYNDIPNLYVFFCASKTCQIRNQYFSCWQRVALCAMHLHAHDFAPLLNFLSVLCDIKGKSKESTQFKKIKTNKQKQKQKTLKIEKVRDI